MEGPVNDGNRHALTSDNVRKGQMSDDKPQVCANCGRPYIEHVEEHLGCPQGTAYWFPQTIREALEKQARKLRRAQVALGKEHKTKNVR